VHHISITSIVINILEEDSWQIKSMAQKAVELSKNNILLLFIPMTSLVLK